MGGGSYQVRRLNIERKLLLLEISEGDLHGGQRIIRREDRCRVTKEMRVGDGRV
jgi:hypothetical protein